MTITTISVIYIIVGSLALVSILLAIITWVKLASTTAAINDLQDELDKKTRTMDVRQQKSYTDPSADGIASGPVAQVFPQAGDQKIEIVRNVRSQFDTPDMPVVSPQSSTDPHTMPTATYATQPPVDKESDHKQTMPVISPDSVEPQEEPALSPDEGIMFATSNKPEDDVLDVVDEPTTVPPQQPVNNNVLSIPLYSQSSKDADFALLWKTLTEALDKSRNLHVTIDFSNILFLYEKEIEYLLKIHQIATIKGARLSFSNYSQELAQIISQDTTLKQYIGV